VRIGKWKGVKLGWKVKTPQKLQLFDLEKDLGETKNIAAQHPDIVKRMEAIMVEAHQPLPAKKR
jgi:arylsulfatase A